MSNPKSILSAADVPVASDKQAAPDTFDGVVGVIRSALKASVPVVPLSSRSLVEALKPDIRAARASGQTWKQIAAVFRDAGIIVSPETLRIFTSTATPTKAARGKRRQSATAPSPAAPPTPQRDVQPCARVAGARISHRVK